MKPVRLTGFIVCTNDEIAGNPVIGKIVSKRANRLGKLVGIRGRNGALNAIRLQVCEHLAYILSVHFPPSSATRLLILRSRCKGLAGLDEAARRGAAVRYHLDCRPIGGTHFDWITGALLIILPQWVQDRESQQLVA